MRWVFVKPRNHSPYYDPEIQEPLGIEYLAAARIAAGDAALVLDCAFDGQDERRCARRAASFRPDAVGLSLTTAQDVASALAIHGECVRSLGGRPCRWLAGGNFVSTETPAAAVLLPPEMRLVRFEGERVLEELAARWTGCGPSAEPGEERLDERVLCGSSHEDLDALPFPVRPFASQILGSGWAFNVQGSRGCCGACRYCSSPGMMAACERGWRGRSPAHIVEEMADLGRRHGATAFNFVDEDFLGPNALAAGRAATYAGELRRCALDVSFSVQVRPASLSLPILDTLVDSGLIYVFMGLESDDPADFRHWGRPWTEDPWRLVRHLQARGVAVNAGVLMFHPHSTFGGMRRFASRLHEHGLLEYRSARNRLDAMPGSVFHRQAVDRGDFDPTRTGPQPLPFLSPGVDGFYTDVLAALDPLGPPSMHALCALPPILTRSRHDATARGRLERLREIVAGQDAVVAATFFAVLDRHERGAGPPDVVAQLRRRNLDIAVRNCRELADEGFAASFDSLREAVAMDARA